MCALVALRGGTRERVILLFAECRNAPCSYGRTNTALLRFLSARTQRPVNDERALVAHFTGKGGRRPAALPVPLTLVALPVVGTHTHALSSLRRSPMPVARLNTFNAEQKFAMCSTHTLTYELTASVADHFGVTSFRGAMNVVPNFLKK